MAANVVPRSRISARQAKRTSCRSASIPGRTRAVAKRLAGLRYAAELAPRGEPRLGVGKAAATVLVGEQLEVRLQLLAQLVLAPPAGQRPEQTGEQHAQARS